MPICDYITYNNSDPQTTIRITVKDKTINILIKEHENKASILLDLSNEQDRNFLDRIIKSINTAIEGKNE